MRSCAIVLALLGATSLAGAPAPLPRPGSVEALVAVPEGREARALASLVRAPSFLGRALKYSVPPGDSSTQSAEWVERRLDVAVERRGRTLRLTLARCAEAEGLAVMGAVVSEYLCEVLPKRKERRDDIWDEVVEVIEKFPSRERRQYYPALLDNYLSMWTGKQEAALVLQAPRVVGQ